MPARSVHAESPAKKVANAPPSAAELTSAKKHYADGERKYKAADYAGALSDFNAANDIKSTPHAERYVGLCEDALGHYVAAAGWYDLFLAHVPAKLAGQGDEIKKRNAEIKSMPGKVHVESTPPGATVTADDRPGTGGVTPLDIEVAPGPHKIKLTAPGRLPAEKAFDVSFASTQAVTAELQPEPPPPPPPSPPVVAAEPVPSVPAPPPPPARSLIPAYVTGGVALVAAGVGTAFGVIALGDKSDYDKNPTASKADDGDTHSLIADMAFGVAATFGLTSAVLFFTRDRQAAAAVDGTHVAKADAPKRQTVTFTPTPLVGPHRAGAGFVVQF